MSADLVAIPEIAELLGVSRQRASKIIQTYEDFPPAAADLSIGKVWRKDLVQQWARSHPRRTGRPPAIIQKNPARLEGNRPPSGGAGGSRGGSDPPDR